MRKRKMIVQKIAGALLFLVALLAVVVCGFDVTFSVVCVFFGFVLIAEKDLILTI